MSEHRSKWIPEPKIQLAVHPQATSDTTLALPRRLSKGGSTAPTTQQHQSGKKNDIEKREQGFSAYFSGANENKARDRSIEQKQQQQARRTKQHLHIKVSRNQLKEIRRSMEFPFPKAPQSQGESQQEIGGIVHRIAKLPEDRKKRLLMVLQQMEQEADTGQTIEWAEVETQAKMSSVGGVERYAPVEDEDSEEDVEDTTEVQTEEVPPPSWLSAPQSQLRITATVPSSAPEGSPPKSPTLMKEKPSRPQSGRRAGVAPTEAPPVVVHADPIHVRDDSDMLLDFVRQGMETRNHTQHPRATSAPRTLPPTAATPTTTMGPSHSLGVEAVGSTGVPFVVPLLPRGSVLTLNALSTWGDPHYIGATGIDIFDSTGRLVTLNDICAQVIGDPHSINVLPEYKDDPRTAEKLMDSVNYTRDDRHMWLAPYTEGCSHLVTITFDCPVTIAMIRVWNYNKSRVHSFRGMRYIHLSLDSVLIFRGEVKQASGVLENCEKSTEVILFTTEPTVILSMEKYYAELFGAVKEAEKKEPPEPMEEIPRPRTSGGRSGGRPTTAAQSQQPSFQQLKQQASIKSAAQSKVVEVATMKIELLSTWGDQQYIGLGRIAILDAHHSPIPVNPNMITCSLAVESSELSQLFGPAQAPPPDQAFIVPLQPANDPVTLYIRFPMTVKIAGIRVWNYNKSLEDTFTGVKRIRMHIGSVCISPPTGTYVRKAPGHNKFDIAHTILVDTAAGGSGGTPDGVVSPANHVGASVSTLSVMAIRQARLQRAPVSRSLSETIGYEPILLPIAYVFKFVLASTHGDVHYIGLTGIELYDIDERPIMLEARNLQAVPRDVSTALPSCQNDIRCLENLIDGENENPQDENIWLAPYTPGVPNILYVIFEHPTAISLVKIWNYAKTTSRGVKDISVFADDLMVFTGALSPCPHRSNLSHQSLLFTANPLTVSREMKHLSVSVVQQAQVGEGTTEGSSPSPFDHPWKESE